MSPSGVDAELYYVRNNIVNYCALSFTLPVPSETNSLHFTWHSKTKVHLRTQNHQLFGLYSSVDNVWLSFFVYRLTTDLAFTQRIQTPWANLGVTSPLKGRCHIFLLVCQIFFFCGWLQLVMKSNSNYLNSVNVMMMDAIVEKAMHF